MANANWPILSLYYPHDGFAEGSDEGVLLILLIGGDITLGSDFFFTSSQLDHPQNDEIAPPLRSPLVARHVPSFLHCAWVFFVGCCVYCHCLVAA
jgi:hypothetical protein